MTMFTKEINKDVPIPLYYQLKNIIKTDIENGTLKTGDTIPTEMEIMSHYNISRFTVRQAISELVNEGYLLRKTSKVTFVTEPNKKTSFIKSFEPFHQQIQELGKTPHTELLDMSVMKPDDRIRELLRLGTNDKVISLFRRRFADATPVVTIQNYLPYNLCHFVLSHDFKDVSLYNLFMSQPETCIDNTRTIVSAETATPEDVKLLEVKPGSPMLCFNNISTTSDGTIIDYAYAHYRGDMNKFEINESPK